MVALSSGYYIGGRLADFYPRPVLLLHLVSAAALSVLVVPFFALKVTESLAPEGAQIDLLWGPLSAALLLFALPGCLLGTVTPFTIKLLSQKSENERVGTSAGTISGLSTVGSVLGTFGSGFLLIPTMSIRIIFIVVGLVLATFAAIGYAGILGTRSRSLPTASIVIIGALFFSFVAHASVPPRGQNVIYETDTYYHRIEVKRWDQFGRRVIEVYMDNAPEGAQFEGRGELRYEYTKYYRLVRIFSPQTKRAAFLGGGAYSMPEALVDDYPDAQVDVAEIDPEVAQVGRRFFRLGDYSENIHAITSDARTFLRGTKNQYDFIFGDAYRGRQNVPAHLVTREFFDLVRRRLTSDGVFMMNLIGALRGPNSRFFSSVASTILEVFPELYVFAIFPAHPDLTQNLILVAPSSERGWTRDDLIERSERDPELLRMVRSLVPRRDYDLSNSTVLTDDFNPVQYIIARQLRESD